MLIKFSILWVEDDDRWFSASKPVLERYLGELGFYLDVNRIADPENTDWETHFEATSQYDLMLVDWRVETTDETDKAVGGDIIAKIRDQIPYSDILFYSGSEGLELEVYEKALQGVYTAKRNEVLDEAKELIDHLLHKTLHPKIMRGIIVSSLSQIDEMCFKIIKKKYNDDGCDKGGFAEGLRKSIIKQADSQHKSKERSANKGDDEFIASLHSTMILDSFKRAKKVVELVEGELDANKYQMLSDLPGTIQKRNWLAHWKHIDQSDTQIVLAEEGKEHYVFDQTEATRMRKKINEAATILSDHLEVISTEAD